MTNKKVLEILNMRVRDGTEQVLDFLDRETEENSLEFHKAKVRERVKVEPYIKTLDSESRTNERESNIQAEIIDAYESDGLNPHFLVIRLSEIFLNRDRDCVPLISSTKSRGRERTEARS